MRPYPAFIGGTYRPQSTVQDCEQTVNWYTEVSESSGSVSRIMLLPTPGQEAYIETAGVGAREIIAVQIGTTERAFAVVGSSFYELFSTQTATLHGTVAQDAYPATISYNGDGGGQLFITSGGNGYCFDLSTNTLTTELTGDATMGGMIDGYFLAFDVNTSTFRISDLLDGTTWDPTQFAQRSIAPDPWQAMAIGSREIWFIGTLTGEVWYDAGSFPFPFAPVPGAFFQEGTSAPFSVKPMGESMVWVARNKDGTCKIVRARGYTPETISTRSIESELSEFERTSRITDAETMVYQQEGHLFACFRFASANATRVFDSTPRLPNPWHNRGKWHAATGTQQVWSPRVHCVAFGKHLVGDSSTGTISVMDVTFGTETDGTSIVRERIGPPIFDADRELFNQRFQIVLEPGLGLSSGQGSDPQVMFQLSRDGGKTWSNERWASAGAIGQYEKRVFWTRNGMARMPVPRIRVSDPIPWRIMDALIGLRASA